MKQSLIRFSRNCLYSATCAAFLAGAGLAGGTEIYTSPTEEPEVRKDELVLSFGHTTLQEGSESAFQAATGEMAGRRAGLDSFYSASDPYGDWVYYLEGRAMAYPDEISFDFELFKPERFSIELSFQRWTEFDHPGGIWYTPSDTYLMLAPEALETDINRVQLTLRYTPSDTLAWQLRYTLLDRSGDSLSTRFGDDFQYRVTGPRSRGIVPALKTTDETVHTVDLSLQQQEEAKRTGVRLHYERRQSDNKLVAERAVQEPGANRFQRQEESTDDDLFSASAYARRQLTDTLVGSVGAAFTRLDGDITGERIFGSDPDAAYFIGFPGTQLNDRGFLDLQGTRRIRQWILNANLVYEPEGDFRIMTGVRMEILSTNAFSSYVDTVDRVDWVDQARQDQEADMIASGSKSATDTSAFLEVRYAGIPKAHLYARLEGATQSGSDHDESWTRTQSFPEVRPTESLLDRTSSFDRNRHSAEVGAHYYPFTGFRLSVSGYFHERDNDYDFGNLLLGDGDVTLYPGYVAAQKLETEGARARLHWRILSGLKSVSRIEVQTTDISTSDTLGGKTQSSSRERLIFNQGLTWTPHPRVFLSASYSLVEDLTELPYPEYSGFFSGVLVNLPNDYWQADADLYLVVLKWLDLQLGYHYLDSNSYFNNAPQTVPYGSELEQHQASASAIFHLHSDLTLRLSYQYFEQTDRASPMSARDYQAHIVSGSFQARF